MRKPQDAPNNGNGKSQEDIHTNEKPPGNTVPSHQLLVDGKKEEVNKETSTESDSVTVEKSKENPAPSASEPVPKNASDTKPLMNGVDKSVQNGSGPGERGTTNEAGDVHPASEETLSTESKDAETGHGPHAAASSNMKTTTASTASTNRPRQTVGSDVQRVHMLT